jgi:hypothetical protein
MRIAKECATTCAFHFALAASVFDTERTKLVAQLASVGPTSAPKSVSHDFAKRLRFRPYTELAVASNLLAESLEGQKRLASLWRDLERLSSPMYNGE